MNQITVFDETWEFVSEVNSLRVDFSKKLNQWKHQYNLVVIDVMRNSQSEIGTVDFTIARQLRTK